MCGGGGGGSGTQQYNWNDDIAPYWRQSLQQAQDLTQNTPYQRYQGQRIADINSDQTEAMNAIRGFAREGGNPTTVAANGQLWQTLSGNYLTGDQSNPYALANNPYATAQNRYMGQDTTTDRNQYAGTDSTPFNNVLQHGLGNITTAYQNGTARDTDRAAALAGAFGGGAHQRAVSENQRQLGETLNNYTQGMLNDQLNRSSGLEENYLNRDVQNQQFNRAGNAALYENYLNRANQGSEAGINRGFNAFENERGRQLGAVGGGQNEQNLALQRFNAMMGVGDINRGYSQDLLNQGYQDWQEQQNYPFRMMDYMTGILGRAQGGMSPNMQYTTPGYSASPFSQLLGAGLMGHAAGFY